MNPCSCAPLALVAVGKGGREDVSVVARRVGLKRRDDAWGIGVSTSEYRTEQPLRLALPNQTIVAQVLEHRPLRIAKVLC